MFRLKQHDLKKRAKDIERYENEALVIKRGLYHSGCDQATCYQ